MIDRESLDASRPVPRTRTPSQRPGQVKHAEEGSRAAQAFHAQ
jgi:hypothetical protein